jgi:hypothetical protein
MGRVVVVILLLLGLAGYKLASRSPTGPASQLAGKEVYEGYVEVRVLMQAEQREIELVAIEERPAASDCENRVAGNRVAAMCPSKGKNKNVSCTLKSLECSREVEPRYRKMLDQQPVSTHYAHMQIEDGSAKPRRAVVLGWGMTEDESLFLCNAIRESASKKTGGTVTCI